MKVLEKIISGGQTGVDRAALDFAIDNKIPHGGWVPNGRIAEDGQIPDRYQMEEHLARTYPPRTKANVRDADATVIFTNGLLNQENGCLLTASACLEYKNPYAVISLVRVDDDEAVLAIETLLREHRPKILNVAGTRGGRNPDVTKVRRILDRAIPPWVK